MNTNADVVPAKRAYSSTWASSIISDCTDDMLYVTMRFFRLITMTFFEALCWGSIGLAFMSLLIGFFSMFQTTQERLGDLVRSGHDYLPWTLLVRAPYVFFVVLLAAAFFLMGAATAASTPYRYSTNKPGLGVKKCWHCHKAMQDKFFCPSCGSFRPSKLMAMFLWVLSLLVTVLFAIHDLVTTILFLGAMGGS